MSKILVSLINDQTIPNLQLIKEFDFIDKYLFVSSHLMEQKGNRLWIIKAAEIPTEKLLHTIIVDDIHFEDIEQKFESFHFDERDELYVNITGGTKIMTIVSLNYFKELGAKIFYVTGRNNQYIKVFPKSQQKNVSLKSLVTLNEFVVAHGFKIKSQGALSQTVETTNAVMNFFVPWFQPENTRPSPYSHIFPELQFYRSQSQINISAVVGLEQLLHDMNFKTHVSGKLQQDEICYITGGWLEEYVYNRVKAELQLDEKFIAIGLNLEKREVPNEFDVVFTYSNHIYTIECKTSVYHTVQGKTKTTIGDFVYKSDALQNEFGLYPITAIATLSALKDKNGIVKPIVEAHYKRAELYGVKIFAFADITSGKSFKELLGIN